MSCGLDDGLNAWLDQNLLEIVLSSCGMGTHLSLLALVCRRWHEVCKSESLRRTLFSGFAFSFGGDQWHQEPLGHPPKTSDAMLGYPRRIRAFDGVRVTAVAAGWQHSVFLTEHGQVFTCGVGADGKLGLGDDLDTSHHVPQLVTGLAHVVPKQIAAGAFHTLIVTNKGTVYSFGYGVNGRLGLGDDSSRSKPKLVEGLLGREVVQVSGGNMHSLALDSEGRVFAWGAALGGILGLSSNNDLHVPTLVEALEGERIVVVAAGDFHSLFLNEKGQVFSCGRDSSNTGVLGYSMEGVESQTQFTPRLIPTFADTVATVIAAGEGHSLVATKDRRLFAFGRNVQAELGLGFANPTGQAKQILPTQVPGLPAGVQVSRLVAGASHSLVVTDDGAVYSCGNGENYRLGLGENNSMRTSLTRIELLAPFVVKQVAANGRHNLALL